MKIKLTIITFVIAVFSAMGILTGYEYARASAPQTCPQNVTCNVTITDIGNGLGDALEVRDYLGNPMAWVDTFQLGSTNPVCAASVKSATTGYDQRMACLGGPPFNASGGYPVLALWDGKSWQVLTAQDIKRMHARGM